MFSQTAYARNSTAATRWRELTQLCKQALPGGGSRVKFHNGEDGNGIFASRGNSRV